MATHPLHHAGIWIAEFWDEFGLFFLAALPLSGVALWIGKKIRQNSRSVDPAADKAALPRAVRWSAAVGAPAFWLVSVWLSRERPAFFEWVTQEDNWIENIQFGVLLVAVWLAARITRRLFAQPFGLARLWGTGYAVLTLGIFWAAGEEISWGQRIFHLVTPSWFNAHNVQHEINLHNLGGTDGVLSDVTDFGLSAAVVLGIVVSIARLRRVAKARTLLWTPHPALIPSFCCALCYGLILGVYDVAHTTAPTAVVQLQESRELILYSAAAVFLWEAARYVCALPMEAAADPRRVAKAVNGERPVAARVP